MSMVSYVQGLKPKTEEYKKKLQIYELCKEMNIDPPREIEEFFDGEVCEVGIVTELPAGVFMEYNDDCREYFEVDLTKIPKDVTKIRFVNSY